MAPPRLFAPLAVLFAALVMGTSASSSADRTVTQVVKLLQGMLETSKAEGNSERDLYAKFKCYYDTNQASKTAEIEKLTLQIGLLENEIEELLASTGMLSRDLQQIKRDMVKNKASRDAATAIRNKENSEFLANEAMLEGAILQLKDAISALAEIGADQSRGDAARDHSQYMAKASFADLGKTVKLALVAASSLASHRQISTIEAFLQRTPFTGTYAAQSGEVVGILKDMLDTFKANLKSARAEESQRLAAYTQLTKVLLSAYASLEKLEGEKEADLAANDLSLGTKRTQLGGAQEDKADAETFLSNLNAQYKTEKNTYEEHNRLRNEEQAAIAEAISILNSDSAFATFGTVAATKTGATAFVQYRSIQKHGLSGVDESRKQTQAFLQREASNQHSPLLGRVVAMLQANNPFDVVLAEIEKLVSLIAAEESADDSQLSWCNTERTESKQSITTKEGQISALDRDINNLDSDINDPVTGLLAHKALFEKALQDNHENQVSQTAQRRDENQLYKKDISNLVDAQDLLQRAIVVLRKYYAKIDSEFRSQLQEDKSSLQQSMKNDPFVGQRQGSRSAVTQLEFILKETKAEEKAAHDSELSAQHSYEDAMKALTKDEADYKTAITTIETDLAQKTRDLQVKEKDRKTVHKEKVALEKYLEDIKPGCDYITANIDKRKAHRQEETTALTQAENFIRNSPVYLNAVAAAHDESLGECLSTCTAEGEDHVKCKACLKKTSVPGYCAGHPSTRGCP